MVWFIARLYTLDITEPIANCLGVVTCHAMPARKEVKVVWSAAHAAKARASLLKFLRSKKRTALAVKVEALPLTCEHRQSREFGIPNDDDEPEEVENWWLHLAYEKERKRLLALRAAAERMQRDKAEADLIREADKLNYWQL